MPLQRQTAQDSPLDKACHLLLPVTRVVSHSNTTHTFTINKSQTIHPKKKKKTGKIKLTSN